MNKMANAARALASCRDGSSRLHRVRLGQVSRVLAQIRNRSDPTMKRGMPRRKAKRTACMAAQSATTRMTNSTASGFAAAPRRPNEAPTSTPGRMCDGAQASADTTFAA
jgi:hypothetical protein